MTHAFKKMKLFSFSAFHLKTLLCRNRSRIQPMMACGMSTRIKQSANKRMVYRSLSNNIFENLALEEWIYERTDLSETDVLLVWQSDPCVVIGKHQNPWMEANIPTLDKEGVRLARRSSGGGTVYHDKGNLNLSFLKDRSRYDRRENLELVVSAVKSKWDLDLVINDRDDIILDGVHKISGTAAKLTRNKSYHHFTLLHSVDQSRLSACLASPFRDRQDTHHSTGQGVSIHSRSTKSVPAPVQNLQSSAPEMTLDLLVDAIVSKFLEGESPKSETIMFVNPVDGSWFPGVSDMCDRLESWDWVFGKTPKFSLEIDMPNVFHTGDTFVRRISIGVEKGFLVSFTVVLNNDMSEDLAALFNFKGLKMKRDDLNSVLVLERDDLFLIEKFSDTFPDLVDAKSTLENIQRCMEQFVLCNFS